MADVLIADQCNDGAGSRRVADIMHIDVKTLRALDADLVGSK